MDIARMVVMAYALLIFVALVASIYTLWAYHECPDNRSHRPLIFPIVCSISWFLVGVDQLVATVENTHGSVDGLTLVVLIIITIIALLYFVRGYIGARHRPCPIPAK